MSLLTTVFWNNTGQVYLTAGGVFLFSLLVLYLFKSYVLHIMEKIAKRTKTDLDDYFVEFLAGIHWPFYVFLSLFISAKFLVLPNVINKILFYVLIVLLVFYAVKGLDKVIDLIRKIHIKKQGNEDTAFLDLLAKILKGFIWVVAFLLLLSNLGVNISSLIAGLGIGGIAIALALQNILSDLFSAFTIYFDKPFKKGDFIVIGDDMGTIKKIGLKSTRIQALKGQEIIVSNHELISTRINNYKRMKKRRILFSFGVEYGTSIKKLEKINLIITQIFKKIKLAELDRAHFKEFGDSSLLFEVVYYLDSREYTVYMDTQQEINLAVKSAFEKEKIEMAFPTQTIYLKK